jgi:hypothetical protein
MTLPTNVSRAENSAPVRQAFGRNAVRLGLLTFLVSFAALGQETQSSSRERAEDTRFYAGVGAVSLTFAAEHEGVAFEDSSLGLGGYVGFKLRDNLGVEVSYSSADAVDLEDVWGSGVAKLDIAGEWDTLSVRAVGELSLKEWLRWRRNWRLYGALGGYDSRIRRTVTTRGTGASLRVRDDEAGVVLATGFLYEVGVVDLRGYVEWFGVFDDREAWDAGVAVQMRF